MKNKIKELIQNFIYSTTNIATLNSRALFVRENIEIIKDLTSFLDDSSKVNERLYIIYNDLDENDTKCPMCNNKRKFYTFTNGYNLCCSQSCATKYQQAYLITNKEEIYSKRSLKNFLKTKEQKDSEKQKRKNTIIERYGSYAFSDIAKKGVETKKSKGVPLISGFRVVQQNNPILWIEMHIRAADTMKNNIDENGNNHYDRVHLKKLNDIDEDGNNFYERMHLIKLNDIDENGNNFYERMILKNYESGFWVKPEDKPDFEHYRVKVYKSMYRFKDEIKKLENFDKRGHANKGMYHLDHKFSIYEGFKQNVPPYIIGHINNLEMIIGRNNLSKSRKCSIELVELVDSVFESLRNEYKLSLQ